MLQHICQKNENATNQPADRHRGDLGFRRRWSLRGSAGKRNRLLLLAISLCFWFSAPPARVPSCLLEGSLLLHFASPNNLSHFPSALRCLDEAEVKQRSPSSQIRRESPQNHLLNGPSVTSEFPRRKLSGEMGRRYNKMLLSARRRLGASAAQPFRVNVHADVPRRSHFKTLYHRVNLQPLFPIGADRRVDQSQEEDEWRDLVGC